ncbi:hypothetical protein SNEBB_008607, partial [Seison nebaliae]
MQTIKMNSIQENFNPSLIGDNGIGTGISTMGFRTSKYTPVEWHENNHEVAYSAFATRNMSENARQKTQKCIYQTAEITNKLQKESTERLKERLKDINSWKQELHRDIDLMKQEIDDLLKSRTRLQLALDATYIPLEIATENLETRRRKYGVCNVTDEVELQLFREVELLNTIQKLLKRTIEEADIQQKGNKRAKEILELDWSNKLEAERCDSISANRKNTDKNNMYYMGAAKFIDNQSTPESWAENCHHHLVSAQSERMTSEKLRQLIDNMLSDTTKDLRQQADTVDKSVSRRIQEIEDALNKLRKNEQETIIEITNQEKNIADIRAAIKAKEAPLKVAQSRLHDRGEFRPQIESCRDPAQEALIFEVQTLTQSIDALKNQLSDGEFCLRSLQDSRMNLAKEIQMKENSLELDKDRVGLT